MRNHSVANNTRPINQKFGNNLKSVVGNDNEPEVLDNNNTLYLRNEKNNIRIHFREYLALNK